MNVRVLKALVYVGLLLTAGAGLRLQAAEKEPAVGFVRVDADKYFAEEQRFWRFGATVLDENGFRFGLFEWRALFGTPTTADRVYQALKPFNVAVIDVPYESSIMELAPARRQAAAAAREGLQRYIREGGSVLLVLQAVRYPGDKDQDYANLVIEGLGVQMLHEGIFDRKRTFTAPIASVRAPEDFFWTENITPDHPVTKGVRRLCLPEHHSGHNPGVVAMQLSEDWQVLVRGEASAKSYRVSVDRVTDYEAVGTYRTAPPIVAARSFGKGRVVAYSVPARCAYHNYGVPGWNMIVEQTGDAKANRPSDGGRLMLNAIRWLAEANRDNAEVGTFESSEPLKVTFPERVEFDSRQFRPPVQGIRGIIGARTALSDGQGTVADYVRAAKAAGLSFIVFTESLESLTAEELEQLHAQCKAASDASFYACPGVEFSDDLGNRWAIWSERVVYPQASFQRTYGKTTPERPALEQWDGKVMHNIGQYLNVCSFSPSALLNYRHMREKGAHPANMWWFFRVAPFVYTRGKLVEDQFDEWLWALRDCRAVDTASYTRVYSPDGVARAAEACVTAGRDLPSMQKWLNTRCANYGHPARPYVTQGPRIDQWEVINNQFDLPLDVRGIQRARCRFEVASPAGIREVTVHDADYGPVRRFLGHGEKTLAREFEWVHDRDHYLTLKVTDNDGRVAVSTWVYLWCYKTTLFRCADNLNFLNGVALVWHPWNQMMPLAQGYQGMPAEAIRGYDTAVAFTGRGKLVASPLETITTRELKQYPLSREHGLLRKVLDIQLPGNDVKICRMTMGPLVEPFDTLTRDTPAMANVPPVIAENELFSRVHRTTYFQNRNNMFITWNYRRAREGAENYRGGIAWHEGSITFKRDATLSGTVPAPLLFMRPVGVPEGTSTHILVTDAEGGPIVHPLKEGEAFRRAGTVAPGGFLTAAPADEYAACFAGADTPLRYQVSSDPKTGRVSQLVLGVGQDGRQVKAGDVLRYRFAVATLGGPRMKPQQYVEKLKDIADSFGLGGQGGVEAEVSVGSLLGREMFLTLRAEQGEAKVRVKPRRTIVDLPIRVEGVQDNGCAAVYSTDRPWFRWVGVWDGAAYFQEDVDTGSDIWAGNVFLCDNPAIRLTLLTDGQAEGKPPVLEIHNPTDKPVTAEIVSPPHTPGLGGTRLRVDVPAGSSVTKTITPTR